ncbi:MAG: hypothetical protein AAF705_00325 [Bacteroidota bacterium]
MKTSHLFSFLTLLTLSCFLHTSSLLAQQQDKSDRDLLMRSLELEDLSEEGKDEFFSYFSNDPIGTLNATKKIKDPKTPEEAKAMFQDYFRDRVDTLDYQLISRYWDKQIEKHRDKTLARAALYRVALANQRRTVDSLLAVYYEDLKRLSPSLNELLTENERASVRVYYQEGIKSMTRKKDEFLNYELKFSYAIDPIIYQSMKYGFELMEKIPSSYYYALTGASRYRLKFVEKLVNNDYVEQYKEFEYNLDSLLSKKGYRAHSAIPFYHLELRNKAQHSISNALLFAYIENWLDAPVKEAVVIDWPICSTPTNANQQPLSALINTDKLAELGFSSSPGMSDPNIGEPETMTLISKEMEMIGIALLKCEDEEIMKTQASFSNAEKKELEIVSFDGGQAISVLSADNTNTIKRQSLVYLETGTFLVFYYTDSYDEERGQLILQALSK